MSGQAVEAAALVQKIEPEMLEIGAAPAVCRYSAETFTRPR